MQKQRQMINICDINTYIDIIGSAIIVIELKKYLSDTDYKAIKFAEGEITESDYQEVKSQRHNARVRINELESLIEELEKGNKEAEK